jgi:hypothetical protein
MEVVRIWIGFDVDSRAGIGLWSKRGVIAEGYAWSQSCTRRANCDFAASAEIRAWAGKIPGNSGRAAPVRRSSLAGPTDLGDWFEVPSEPKGQAPENPPGLIASFLPAPQLR